jgi:hypothetical protein
MNERMAAPVENKVTMDKDYDYYIAKYNTQPPPPPPPKNAKYQGNLGAVPMEPVSEQNPRGSPPHHPAAQSASPQGRFGSETNDGHFESKEQVDGDEALLDLAQLEELHVEAERMKALGNKHMAAQVSSCGCR